MSKCLFCEKVPALLKDKSSFIVHEFKHSVLMVGEHQTYPGYCVLVLKNHAVELFDLDSVIQSEFNLELMQSTRAIKKIFSADKMNVSSYGNMTPHLHWHIFPRKSTDSNWPEPPWTLMKSFKDNQTTNDTAQKISALLAPFLTQNK